MHVKSYFNLHGRLLFFPIPIFSHAAAIKLSLTLIFSICSWYMSRLSVVFAKIRSCNLAETNK